MGDNDQDGGVVANNILPRRKVLYCGACGMPLEYCEYGPDFESDCNPWLLKNHADLYQELQRGKIINKKSGSSDKGASKQPKNSDNKPDRPWTTEERLTAFYQEYLPEKIEGIPALLEKYAGKEEKLFQALVKKYGPEPYDPYYYDDGSSSSDDEDDDEDDDDDNDDDGEAEVEATATTTGQGSRNKRRGASAKKKKKDGDGDGAAATRVLVQKVAKKKRRNLTIISGMETVPGVKSLKDVSKVFSKKFAGSSSVKKNAANLGKEEIIIQGDHLYEVAEMIVDSFKVDETAVYLDIEGDIVPLR